MLSFTPLDFIVMGLPRSATTWIANWLTADGVLCIHDPFSYGDPGQWPADNRVRGISCTAAYLLPQWVDQYECPVAVIERPAGECINSLEHGGMDGSHLNLGALSKAKGQRFVFDDLWNEESAKELHDFLLPDRPFDALRYQLLRDMNVQPHMQHWISHMPDLQKVCQSFVGGD